MYKNNSLPALLLLCFLAGTANTLTAQSTKVRTLMKKPHYAKNMLQAALKPVPYTGFEKMEAGGATVAVPAAHSMLRNLNDEEIMGTTGYDLQTNGTEQARLHVWPDGKVSAGWTQSLQTDGSGWPDRGTGYNTRANWTANPPVQPTARLEPARTGFTNYVVTEDGTELSFAHRGNSTILSMRKAAGETAWTPTDLATQPDIPAQLWCKAVADGNTVHVISLANGSYRGMSGHLIYYRSKDAGKTWEGPGFISGIDSTNFGTITSDAYSITARDGTVAVAIFDSWSAVKIFKSTNGGDTWEAPLTMLDFPLKRYKYDQGYTLEDFNGPDPNALEIGLDSFSIFTNDGAGSIVLDALGNVHAFVGEMYVLDRNLSDNNFNYYPGINGLMYWNETMPEGEPVEIAFSADWDGNDTLDIDGGVNAVAYGTSISSMPAAAVDDNGGLYVIYSALVERLVDDAGNQYRHTYVYKSPDLGENWYWPPTDIQYQNSGDPDSLLANLTEAVFPSVYKYVKGDKLHYSFQRDYSAGSAVNKTGTQATEIADMVYIADANIVSFSVGAKETLKNKLEFAVNPNPAATRALVHFTLAEKGETMIEICDLTGRAVRRFAQGNLNAGAYNIPLSMEGLGDGFYFVRVQSGQLSGTKKLMVLNR